jgi:dTDP-4-amino-4,6-dideoxygalactose transaminase
MSPTHNPDNPLGHRNEAEIPVFQPHLGVDTVKAVVDAFSVGWLGMGSVTKEFEDAIATYLELDERYVVATNTGTSALHLALLAANVGAGDEVIVPSFDFVADHQAIMAVGAAPVFCDIREDTLGIDVEKAEALISTRTKAILCLHYAGIPCDVEGVYTLAELHRLRVIEDATHAFGTRYASRMIGGFGDITCFSFDPVKVITSIDGGAVVANTSEEMELLRHLRFLGITKDTLERYRNQRAWEYDVVSVGFRYHLTNINAAIGLSQLRRVDEFIGNRQAYCQLYNRLLGDIPGIAIPCTTFRDVSPFIYYLRVQDHPRDRLIAHLRSHGIQTGIHWIPAHRFTLFAECRRGDLTVTNRVAEEVLTLPLHSFMRFEVIHRIASEIRKALAV